MNLKNYIFFVVLFVVFIIFIICMYCKFEDKNRVREIKSYSDMDGKTIETEVTEI